MNDEVKKFLRDIFTGLNGYFPKCIVYSMMIETIITACGVGIISPEELLTAYNHLTDWERNDSN